jgi:hypothetical protein
MKKLPVFDDRDGELFLAKMREATKPEASEAEFTDPATEAAIVRGAAQYVMFVTNLNHRTDGHAGPSSEDCGEEKCVAGVEAAEAFIEMAQL